MQKYVDITTNDLCHEIKFLKFVRKKIAEADPKKHRCASAKAPANFKC